MIKPEVLSPNEDVNVVGYVFDTPLVTKKRTWLPLAQLVTWLVMAFEAGRLHPERRWWERLGVASLTMPVVLGSEWCHNLAHAAAAKWIGKPVDAIRISWGMPLLVYHDIEDHGVAPRGHLMRALGGPLFNLVVGSLAAFLRRFVKAAHPFRDVIDAVTGTNIFLFVVGLTPQPWLDGGAILKWFLVDKGRTLEAADQVVCRANGIAAVGMGMGAAAMVKKQKVLLGVFLAWMASLSLAAATGLFREK